MFKPDNETLIQEAIERALTRASVTRRADKWAVLGNFDGRLQPGEVFTLGLVFLLLLGIGSLLRLVAIAGGTHPVNASMWLYAFGVFGGLLVSAYVVLEMYLALFGRDPDAEPPPPVLEEGPIINISVTDRNGKQLRFLRFKGAQAERAARFVRLYRELCADETVDYPLAEKHYVGPVKAGKVWSNSASGESGRPGWEAFWAEMIRGRLAEQEESTGRRSVTRLGEIAFDKLLDKAGEAGL